MTGEIGVIMSRMDKLDADSARHRWRLLRRSIEDCCARMETVEDAIRNVDVLVWLLAELKLLDDWEHQEAVGERSE